MLCEVPVKPTCYVPPLQSSHLVSGAGAKCHVRIGCWWCGRLMRPMQRMPFPSRPTAFSLGGQREHCGVIHGQVTTASWWHILLNAFTMVVSGLIQCAVCKCPHDGCLRFPPSPLWSWQWTHVTWCGSAQSTLWRRQATPYIGASAQSWSWWTTIGPCGPLKCWSHQSKLLIFVNICLLGQPAVIFLLNQLVQTMRIMCSSGRWWWCRRWWRAMCHSKRTVTKCCITCHIWLA